MSGSSLLGRTIDGKYRLDAVVGRGAMATVYKATQLSLQKTVAIKVMKQELAREEAYGSRFKREAKAASRLDHPNSLRIIDFGDDDGLLYIAMEYLDGRDLLAVVSQDFPLPPARIVDILSQTLAALAVAHEMGIVHRDLKPENVMVVHARDDDGHAIETVKVCDFGVAKLLPAKRGDDTQSGTATGTLTALGTMIGTPEYMSPEQVIGEEKIDARSDIYSLGVILYQLLTRTLPFEHKSPIELAIMQLERAPTPPSQRVPDVDPRLEAVCLKALRKVPGERYASAREMRTDLRTAFGGPDSVVGRRADGPAPSTRVIPQGESAVADEAALSKAATLLAPAPEAPRDTGKDLPVEVRTRRRNRVGGLLALVAILCAVALLFLLAR